MSEFTDYLRDVFADFGAVSVRSMFGGHGIYFDDCMFGLVADDMLYLKVDAENKHWFTELDLPPFEYNRPDGKVMAMSYYLAPESLFEEPEEAVAWAQRSWEAARRAKGSKKKVSKKKVGKKKVSKKKVSKKKVSKKKISKKKIIKKKITGNSEEN